MSATMDDYLRGLNAWMATQPQQQPCSKHPDQMASLVDARKRDDGWQPIYAPCVKCELETKEQDRRERLRFCGAPADLLHATVDNWVPPRGCEHYPKTIADFARTARGFLILTGTNGNGKTHLAVAAMRLVRGAIFVKQREMLRALRRTYDPPPQARDPIPVCQKAAWLMLDELVIPESKDEAQMLDAVIDYRYCELLPTIVTTNLSWNTLRDGLGERLADRLRECAEILSFTAESHRPKVRARYFEQPKPEGQRVDLFRRYDGPNL